MNNYQISMFVDNELDLDEKIEFVETVHSSTPFKNETVELLKQEKLLQADMVTAIPNVSFPAEPVAKTGILRLFFPPLAGFATAMALVIAVFLAYQSPVENIHEAQYRFVIYRPDVKNAEIVGDFTRWSPIQMEKLGNSGYWSVTLKLPAGEHRYSYLVDNNVQITDPTVQSIEQDDFGGVNSIITIAGAI